jgi:hypothetical protein
MDNVDESPKVFPHGTAVRQTDRDRAHSVEGGAQR